MSTIITGILVAASLISALDYGLGSPLKLGQSFVKGIHSMGMLFLSMVGIYLLSPIIGQVLSRALMPLIQLVPIDSSVFVGLTFAPDMGGVPAAEIIALDPLVGQFSGIILTSLVGATLVFTLPIAVGMIKKEDQGLFIKGLVFGLITVPIGGLVSGLMMGIELGGLLMNLLPVILFSCLMSWLLYKKPDLVMTLFTWVSKGVLLVSLLGLSLGILDLMLNIKLLRGMIPLEEGLVLVGKITIILSGAYPLLSLLNQTIEKKLSRSKSQVNPASLLGLFATLANCVPVFMTFDKMDQKGKVYNSAFVVGGGFVFGGQFAYISAVADNHVPAYLAGKLIAGISAVLVAAYVLRKQEVSYDNK